VTADAVYRTAPGGRVSVSPRHQRQQRGLRPAEQPERRPR
jgi:hypothetical protein